MKGKKLIFAVILSLIVCLVLIPTCAYASELPGDNSTVVDGEQSPAPTTPPAPTPGVEPTPVPTTEPTPTPTPGTTPAPTPTPGATPTPAPSATPTPTPTPSSTPAPGTESTPAPGTTPPPAADDGSIGFVVEFSYGDKTYKLENLKGNEQFGLTDILKELGIEGSIDAAKGDADDLFAAENGENGWKVTTKKAFGTKQTMTVVVDGVEYVLGVIDDMNAGSQADIDKILDENDEATIKLTNDFNANIVIASGKTITINLNGHTLTSKDNGHTITVESGGKLILNGTGTVDNTKGTDTGGSAAGYAALAVEAGGYAVINEGVTLKRSAEKGTAAGGANKNSYYTVRNYGELYINGGTIENKGTHSSCVTNGYYDPTGKTNDPYLEVNGGTIIGGKNSIKNDDRGVLDIRGGTFKNANEVVILNWNVADIRGGTFETETGAVLDNAHYDAATSASKLHVHGGTFTSGGSIFKESSKSLNGVNTIIEGGSFNGTISNTMTGHVGVSGGVFSDKNIENLVTKNDTVIAKSGDKYAINLSALDLAKPGATPEIVNLPADYEVEEKVDLPAGVTIVNKTNKNITINGITIKAGESYTTPIPAATTGEVYYAKYYVVEGKEQEWTKGSADGLKFELNSDKVVKVLIDGVEVEFTVENGEIVIAPEVLEALEAGEHEIEFIFDDGSCKTTFVIA